ncbi:5'-methylthioadenosine/S-adenosylhomocysteine nucleosidase [Lederbergia graminis]|uniref:5'-methylthioadenosine/S-adenosylhomocysteine nucleosidase n=1 Tax=Lederbergia graminis TaxID=735518 RepID=A0ABW0LLA0_9BACI
MKIAIIGAMDEEIELLREQIADKNEEIVAGSVFITGTLHGKDVVLLRSGIGKVNAAMSTTILMERYQPDYIINTGSAGGYNPSLKIGNLVISNEVRHHDVDVTAFGYEYGQVPQLPAAFKANEALLRTAIEGAKKLPSIHAVTGLIATGDTFMSDPERVEFVRKTFKDLQAVEMEGAAIAQVAHQYGIPFVVIRALSDIAGQESDISFDQFLETAAVNSANLVMEIVKLM